MRFSGPRMVTIPETARDRVVLGLEFVSLGGAALFYCAIFGAILLQTCGFVVHDAPGLTDEGGGLVARVRFHSEFEDFLPTTVSYDTVSPTSDEGGTFANTIADDPANRPDAVYERRELCRQMEGVLVQLLPAQRLTLMMRFGFIPSIGVTTLQAVSDVLLVSKERVRQIELDALRLVRCMINRERVDRSFEDGPTQKQAIVVLKRVAPRFAAVVRPMSGPRSVSRYHKLVAYRSKGEAQRLGWEKRKARLATA